MSLPTNGKKNGAPNSRAGQVARSDGALLRQIGRLLHQTLYEQKRPVEWLSFKSGVARSTIREIIAGRSNPRIATLNALARSLGFSDLIEFLNQLRKT